jgi:hypothetical protein
MTLRGTCRCPLSLHLDFPFHTLQHKFININCRRLAPYPDLDLRFCIIIKGRSVAMSALHNSVSLVSIDKISSHFAQLFLLSNSHSSIH